MALVLGGLVVEVPSDLEVISWADPGGYGWRVDQRHAPSGRLYCTARTVPPTLGVLHATGGERGASAVYKTLTDKGYSVELIVDRAGTVYELMDPVIYHGIHTGGLNAHAIGIEFVNSMYPAGSIPGRARSHGFVQVVSPRPKDYPDDFVVKAGRKLYYRRTSKKPAMGLLPAQVRTARLLVPLLSDHLGIDLVLADPRGYVPRAERAALRGWLCHSMVTLGHGDPSLDVLEALG